MDVSTCLGWIIWPVIAFVWLFVIPMMIRDKILAERKRASLHRLMEQWKAKPCPICRRSFGSETEMVADPFWGDGKAFFYHDRSQWPDEADMHNIFAITCRECGSYLTIFDDGNEGKVIESFVGKSSSSEAGNNSAG